MSASNMAMPVRPAEAAPFDTIILAAAAQRVPPLLCNSSRLVAE